MGFAAGEAALGDEVPPAAFVRAEDQRGYAPLLLLWRGIGACLVRHPRYRHLFGAVSITNHDQPLSRALMVQYLGTHSSGRTLGE